MKTIFLHTLLTFLLVILGSNKIYPCSCIGENSVKQEIKGSDAVLSGVVVNVDTIKIYFQEGNANFFRLKVDIQVISIFKGRLNSDIISVYSGIGDGDCGYSFQLGKEYLIYADFKTRHFNFSNSVQKLLYTDICKRTCALNNDELKEISRYRKPREPVKNIIKGKSYY